ncbi:OsmC family protein [Prosthecomicrobium pneumaticum]|uniref:Putative OsmC-like protein n=1 Tax=Prosthecomicrobium pneumaticum TaxID=81895 RepID=A0A7W9CTL5_9HYPH|nr:OsmC family protein [Prosthecomicrobium pneumaticum]MBB5751627.1 putative OsmC-like protein [Prosthecomicrobium pneumaticum]
MAIGTIKLRPTGATATLGRTGHPEVVSVTGGALTVVTRPAEPGFNPLDLLYASVSACLVLSARIAASELGLLDRFESARAEVTGRKAADDPARIERFDILLTVEGALDAAERAALIERAERICTVSNTLKAAPAFVVNG